MPALRAGAEAARTPRAPTTATGSVMGSPRAWAKRLAMDFLTGWGWDSVTTQSAWVSHRHPGRLPWRPRFPSVCCDGWTASWTSLSSTKPGFE